MKTHEYKTAFELSGQGDYRRWYDRMDQLMCSLINRESATRNSTSINGLARPTLAQSLAEKAWMDQKRPYYTVYPVASESLNKIDLDLDCSLIKLPLDSLLIRFGVGHEPLCHHKRLKSILVKTLPLNWAGDSSPGMTCWMDFDDFDPEISKELGFRMPIYNYVQFPLVSGKTVEEMIDFVPHHDPEENDSIKAGLRFVLGICLLGSDPEVIKPDVLSKDRDKYERTRDPLIVERAHRRGKIGYLVGADWEMMPHYRRPHFALRWTGEGRRVPKIVPVRGAVIHRTKLIEVPQGRLDT